MGEVKIKEIWGLDRIPILIPFVFFGLYSLGYAYMKSFYVGVGVNFEYYVSLTDILFFTIDYLIKLVVYWGIFEIYFILFFIFFKEFFLLDIIFLKKQKINSLSFLRRFFEFNKLKYYSLVKEVCIMLLALVTMFGYMVVIKKENSFFREIVFFSPLAASYFFYYYFREKMKKNLLVILMLFGFYFGGIFSMFAIGINDSKVLSSIKNTVRIEFAYNGENYSTFDSNKFVLIGDTSNYIFLFDKDSEETIAFRKDNIDLIRIRSNKKITDVVDLID